MSFVVGIDLGTTNSVIAFVNGNGKPEIIRNELGRSITPSVIYFGEGAPIVGDRAKEEREKKEVVQLFKRSMNDSTLVDFLASMLVYMKAQAERHLKAPVTDAVITVPAYFTDPQRKAAIKAGEQAGLCVLAILDKPTAVALAYDALSAPEESRILVYDLGGSAFDVSLISTTSAAFQVIATDGNNRLGGANWDDCLLEYVANQCWQAGIELRDDDREGLYTNVEQARQALTARKEVKINVRIRDRTMTIPVTRSLFEQLTRHLQEETLLITDRLLRTAAIDWSDLNKVLLVGGATRMPMVRAALEQRIGKPPICDFNPDEVVALGAAIHAWREASRLGNIEPAHFSGRADKPVTIYLAFDLSGSMSGALFEKARQAALAFVERSNTAAIGMLSFSDKATLNLRATRDKKAICQAIERLSPGQTGYGNNGHPFDELYTAFRHVPGQRRAVVLTDGAWSVPELAIRQARRCHAANIEVIAISSDTARQDVLSQIASSAEQGIYIDLDQLTERFGTIAQELVGSEEE